MDEVDGGPPDVDETGQDSGDDEDPSHNLTTARGEDAMDIGSEVSDEEADGYSSCRLRGRR